MSRALVLALVALLPATACAAPPPAAPHDIRARLPDGRTLNFACAGRGSPTILLESGWASDSRGWPSVLGPLSARYRVCGYDRAGSGGSSAGPLPRDGTAIARDLDQGLRAARIAGPFVLVGHSTGGLYVRHFLLQRPRDVAGLVLVDATLEHQQARFEAAFGPGAGSLDPLIATSRACLAAARAGPVPESDRCRINPPDVAIGVWSARLSELEELPGKTSSRLDRPSAALRHLPLITLTAERTYPGPAAIFWFDQHAAIARQSGRGEARVVANSGHGMMWDRPDAIIKAVDDVVARARSGR